MKRISLPSNPVPRLNSLLHRLRQAPVPEGDLPCLDQLMIFLDDPPSGVRDRWKEGAVKCAEWGVACSGASVWRLYRSYAVEWRTRLALQAGLANGESSEALEKKAAQIIVLRTCEILANPATPPATILGLARMHTRQMALELAREIREAPGTETKSHLIPLHSPDSVITPTALY